MSIGCSRVFVFSPGRGFLCSRYPVRHLPVWELESPSFTAVDLQGHCALGPVHICAKSYAEDSCKVGGPGGGRRVGQGCGKVAPQWCRAGCRGHIPKCVAYRPSCKQEEKYVRSGSAIAACSESWGGQHGQSRVENMTSALPQHPLSHVELAPGSVMTGSASQSSWMKRSTSRELVQAPACNGPGQGWTSSDSRIVNDSFPGITT